MTPNEHQIRVEVLTRACAATGSILDTVTPVQLALSRRAAGLPWAWQRGAEAPMMSCGRKARWRPARPIKAACGHRTPTATAWSTCSRPPSSRARLTKDELDARLSQTLAARTYAELAALTADIPPGTNLARHPRPDRAPAPQSTHWVTHQAVKSGAVTIGGLMLAISVLGIVAGHPAIGVAIAAFVMILAALASALVGSLVGATLMLESRRRPEALPRTVSDAAGIWREW